MIRINKWQEIFENADTRKRQRLKSFHCPSGCDSMGYIELMVHHGDNGLAAFGVFQAICQYTATQPAERRGSLGRSSGEAQTIVQLSTILKVSEITLTNALKLLSHPDINWISIDSWDAITGRKPMVCVLSENQSASQSAEICQSVGRNLPALCKEKEKEKEKERLGTNAREPENLNARVSRVVPRIKALLPAWGNLTIRETSPEWREIGTQIDHWEAYDFAAVRDYFASDADAGYKQTKLRAFLDDWGAGMLGKAHEWGKAKLKPMSGQAQPTREAWQIQREIDSHLADLAEINSRLANWHHVANPDPGPGKPATIKILKPGPDQNRKNLENLIKKLKAEKAAILK